MSDGIAKAEACTNAGNDKSIAGATKQDIDKATEQGGDKLINITVGMDPKSVEVPRGSYIAAVRAGG